MAQHKGDCFIEVSNNDIYREIKCLREDLTQLREDLTQLSSKNKISQWMSATALTLTVGVIIGFVLS